MSDRSPASHPPKAILFDIGRVIVQLNPERALAALSATSSGGGRRKFRPADDLWRAILGDSRWHDWQEGRMTPREWHLHLTKRLGLSLSFEEFRAAWNATLEPVPILGDPLFAELGTRCHLGVLSNTDPIHVETLESRYTFLRHFRVRIYSCGVGASKPSPAIYRAALDALRARPAEALYVDDIAEFVQAARALGLDAVQFQNPRQLADDLACRGLEFEPALLSRL